MTYFNVIIGMMPLTTNRFRKTQPASDEAKQFEKRCLREMMRTREQELSNVEIRFVHFEYIEKVNDYACLECQRRQNLFGMFCFHYFI